MRDLRGMVAIYHPSQQMSICHGRPLFLGKVFLDSIHSLCNVLQGVCVGKPQVPLGIGPEIDPWGYSHVGMFKDVESHFVGIF